MSQKQYPQVATTFKKPVQQKAVHYFLFFAKQNKLITEVELSPLNPIFGDDEARKKLAQEILDKIKALEDGKELHDALLKIMMDLQCSNVFFWWITKRNNMFKKLCPIFYVCFIGTAAYKPLYL